MAKYYFLCRLTGSGTHAAPFRPIVATHGRCEMLDLRADATRQEGWCVAALDSHTGTSLPRTSDWIPLGKDPHVPLSSELIGQIKEMLHVNFKSTTLGDILAEILLLGMLPGRGLRPGLDGSYSICLSGTTLWEASENATYDFVGRIREPELLRDFPIPSHNIQDLRPALTEALAFLSSIIEYGQPDWLANEIDKVRRNTSRHPFALNYLEASQLSQDKDAPRLNESAAVIWLMMLAQDIRLTAAHVSPECLSPRLRNPTDCEPAKYELYVMAGYIEAGFRVETTDADHTGEFRVIVEGMPVHIECKYKSKENIAPRRVKVVFENAEVRFRNLLDTLNTYAFLQITCRTDPTLEDLTPLFARIESALKQNSEGSAHEIQCGGKFEITTIPNKVVTSDSGIFMPTGYDYGFLQSRMVADATGAIKPGPGRGFGWIVNRPGGWIRSVVETVRKAAKQVPADSSNILYIHMTTDTLGVVHTRMDSVFPAVEEVFSSLDSYRRVNAVVLTGQTVLRRTVSPQTVMARYIYKTISPPTPRTALPSTFRIFGRDFTRNSRSASPTSENLRQYQQEA